MGAEIEGAPNLQPRQFGKNLFASTAGLATSVASGFLLAPFLIKQMGVAAYGLIPLTFAIVNYLSVANVVLNAAAVRTIAIAIARNDAPRALKVFHTALSGSVCAAAAILACGGIAAWNATAIVNVPAGLSTDARALFLAGTVNVVLLMVGTPLTVAIYYSNRLDVKGLIDVGSRVVYIAMVVGLVALVSPRPAMVGVALATSAAVTFAWTAAWWRRHMAWLSARFRFDKAEFIDLVTFGGWSLIAHTGNMLLLTVDLIIVNRLIGPGEGGIYGAVMQWSSMGRAFAVTVAGVFGQPMAHIYGKEGTAGLFPYAARAVRMVATLMVGPVVAVCGSSKPLLELWLGTDASGHWPLMVALMCHLSYSLAAMPLVTALQTTGNVRAVGLATIAIAGLDVAGAVVLVKSTSLGSLGVAIAGAAASTILYAILVPYFAGAALDRTFRETAAPLPAAAAIGLTWSAVGSAWWMSAPVGGWWGLVGRAVLLATCAVASGWFGILSKSDRFTALDMASVHWKRVRERIRGGG